MALNQEPLLLVGRMAEINKGGVRETSISFLCLSLFLVFRGWDLYPIFPSLYLMWWTRWGWGVGGEPFLDPHGQSMGSVIKPLPSCLWTEQERDTCFMSVFVPGQGGMRREWPTGAMMEDFGWHTLPFLKTRAYSSEMRCLKGFCMHC